MVVIQLKDALNIDTVKQAEQLNQQTAGFTVKCTTIDDYSIPIDESLTTVLSKGAKGIAHLLSMIPRHTALKDGLDMGCDGYVPVEDLLNSRKIKATGVTLKAQDVENIVSHDENQRYKLKRDESD